MEDNPILKNYLKQVEEQKAPARKLNNPRILRSFTGSSCTLENKCKCTHYKRYHIDNEINGVPESGGCIYCNCTCWRARDPEKDKKLAARKRGNQGQYKQYFR